MDNVIFRPINDADLPMLEAWLGQEYVKKWFHAPEDWLREIRGRDAEYAWIHHFIVMDGDAPVGFCQYYDCWDARELEDWYTVERRGDTFSIDYMIGDEASLGKGYGKEIVRMLTELVSTVEQGRRIVVQPERENHASNGVLLANGYAYDEKNGYYVKLLA